MRNVRSLDLCDSVTVCSRSVPRGASSKWRSSLRLQPGGPREDRHRLLQLFFAQRCESEPDVSGATPFEVEARARFERDPLGEKAVPADALYGIQTLRAAESLLPSQGLSGFTNRSSLYDAHQRR